MFAFNHFNFNVSNLDKSLHFYKEALGLEIQRRVEPDDGSFVIVFLEDKKTGFRLELTALNGSSRERLFAASAAFHRAR